MKRRVLALDDGLFLLPLFVDRDAQREIGQAVNVLARTHPWVHPVTPDGRQHAGQVTSWGEWGWWSSRQGGRRYIPEHPRTGLRWPKIPACVMAVWELALIGCGLPTPAADTCLCNRYAPGAGLGSHRDTTEVDLRSPIVTLTLGASARFTCGKATITVSAGDVIVMSGASRNAVHGVSPPFAEQSLGLFSAALVAEHRISLTLRRTGFAPVDAVARRYREA